MTEISHPHDKFFKELFSRPGTAEDFLRNYIPEHIAGILDTETFELVKDSFVDRSLREHFSDILGRVKLKDGTDVYVYVLMEHKSYPDRLTAFQLLRYIRLQR